MRIYLYIQLGQNANAQKYIPVFIKLYEEAYQKALRSNYPTIVDSFVNSYSSVIDFYIKTKQTDKAAAQLALLKRLYNKLSPRYKLIIIRRQANIDSLNGDYLAALKQFQHYNQLNDSIERASSSKLIAEMDAKYQTSEKEKSIKLLAKQKVIQEANYQRVSTQRNITIGGVILMLLIVLLIYKSYRIKQVSNVKLQSQQKEINEQNTLLNHLVFEKDGLLTEKDRLLIEKDWLLKEIHHRVKNNLQVIISLLSAQSSFLKNHAAVTAINESRNRVQAIALIHQKLYSGNNMSLIHMPTYVNDLVGHLQECFDTSKRIITIEKNIDDISLDLTQAVPLGLILNEAITNAIKYAFDDVGGQIIVELAEIGDENFLLSITDNGRGLPDGFELAATNSLGLAMIKALSSQLGGIFKVNSCSGVQISVEFKLDELVNNSIEEIPVS
nr:sensor histidine kinase [Mucilaginibacter sp. L294]